MVGRPQQVLGAVTPHETRPETRYFASGDTPLPNRVGPHMAAKPGALTRDHLELASPAVALALRELRAERNGMYVPLIPEDGHSQERDAGMTPENTASAMAQPGELTPENAELLAGQAGHLERSPLSGHRRG
jgi:hypothetical protein